MLATSWLDAQKTAPVMATFYLTWEIIMNLEKSKKRIAKKVKMGFQGYPEISISYFGSTTDIAEQVAVSFIAEEGATPMEERFQSKSDAREDEVIQSSIVKIIERSEAKTINLVAGVEVVN